MPFVPRVELTSHLRRHIDLAPADVEGTTVRDALDAFLSRHARAASYVFDEQRVLRHHVTIFVDGVAVDRHALDVPVAASAKIFVMQALSGG